jgi:outer membrane protein OmpA-like peptidoglycan-associated protein
MNGTRLLAFVALLGAASPSWLGAQSGGNLRTSEPIRCDNNEELTIRGRLIETDGNGIEIHGNCEVVIQNSHIVAGGIGILVRGNGEVSITDSYVEGSSAGIALEDQSEMFYRGSTIRGGILAERQTEIVDGGGNDTQDRAGARVPEARSSSGSEVRTGAVVVTEEGVQIGPRGAGIVVTEKGVEVAGRRQVDIRDDGSVQVDSGSSKVVVDGDYVRVESANSTVEVSRDWRRYGSSSYGSSDTNRILDELGATTKDGELQLNLAGDVLFDFGSSAIRPDAAMELQKVAHAIRERSAGTIYIIGHTDSVGGDQQNQKLSEARAVSVIRWLNESEEIPLAIMRGQGMGSKKPIAYNTMPDGSDNPEGRAQNRRVEIRFSSRGS